MKSYIIGSSIICALGENKTNSIKRIKDLSNVNYDNYTQQIFTDKKFYFIKDNLDKKTRFFKIIKDVILSALDDANVPSNEYCDLSIFIGSTSINISVIEEVYQENNNLDAVCNTLIVDYITSLLNLKKSSIIFSTACTSSANALIHASSEIKNRSIKRALVLGLEFFNDLTYGGFKSLMLLSESGVYKPLDEQSDGLVLGEACSAIVLESEEQNENNFYILDSCNIFDSYSQTSSNPNGEVIHETMQNSLSNSSLKTEEISLINVHSPGTQTSNEAESNALNKLLKKNKNIFLTSMKPYIGHTLGACSVNELVLLTSCIKNNFIPNTLGVNDSNKFNFSKYQEFNDKINILFSYNGFSGNNISFILSNKK